MKRFAKIAGIVLLAAVLCITAIACQEPKTNFEKVCDNVSAMQQSLYVASDDDFSVKITTMKQEELFGKFIVLRMPWQLFKLILFM